MFILLLLPLLLLIPLPLHLFVCFFIFLLFLFSFLLVLFHPVLLFPFSPFFPFSQPPPQKKKKKKKITLYFFGSFWPLVSLIQNCPGLQIFTVIMLLSPSSGQAWTGQQLDLIACGKDREATEPDTSALTREQPGQDGSGRPGLICSGIQVVNRQPTGFRSIPLHHCLLVGPALCVTPPALIRTYLTISPLISPFSG